MPNLIPFASAQYEHIFNSYIKELKNQLQEQADLQVKAWWENYVKGSAPFRGVKMPLIRSTLNRWYEGKISASLDVNQQIDLAFALFPEKYSEDKLAGTLFLGEILLTEVVNQRTRSMARIGTLFTSGFICDWNICDWFCVKVLGPSIKIGGESWARDISTWRVAENLWLARASIVSFTKVADDGTYYPLIAESCAVMIRREERFAKTAVGWILRDISKHDQIFVKRIIDDNLVHFSTESLKNALKYASRDEQRYYIDLMRETQQ